MPHQHHARENPCTSLPASFRSLVKTGQYHHLHCASTQPVADHSDYADHDYAAASDCLIVFNAASKRRASKAVISELRAAMSSSVHSTRSLTPCGNATVSYHFKFSIVCPEPVLANDRSDQEMAPKKAFATHQPRATQIDKLELVLDQSMRH